MCVCTQVLLIVPAIMCCCKSRLISNLNQSLGRKKIFGTNNMLWVNNNIYLGTWWGGGYIQITYNSRSCNVTR